MKALLFYQALIVLISLKGVVQGESLPTVLEPIYTSKVLHKDFQQDWHAQASQDKFVYLLLYDILQKNDIGYYLEIGAGPPVIINNSHFLEKKLGWKGVSIDISNQYQKLWNFLRLNPLIIEDATKSDYSSILKGFPSVIDYLSLDVDGAYDLVLNQIPFHNYLFKLITIEHDFYRFGDVYRSKEREILFAHGYYLLCPDVIYPACGPFEDWWIHPEALPFEIFSELTSLDLAQKSYEEIIRILHDYAETLKIGNLR